MPLSIPCFPRLSPVSVLLLPSFVGGSVQDADLTEAIVDYQMTLLQQVKGVSERVREVAQERPHKASRKGRNGERNPFTCVVCFCSFQVAGHASCRGAADKEGGEGGEGGSDVSDDPIQN